jgi:hypothetical protein
MAQFAEESRFVAGGTHIERLAERKAAFFSIAPFSSIEGSDRLHLTVVSSAFHGILLPGKRESLDCVRPPDKSAPLRGANQSFDLTFCSVNRPRHAPIARAKSRSTRVLCIEEDIA